MQYSKVIEEGLKNTSLKRIRVKIDPAVVSKECDFSKCNGYEGYILEENAGSLKVLVLTPDMTIEDIPEEFLEYLASEDEVDTFEEFKKFIISSKSIYVIWIDSIKFCWFARFCIIFSFFGTTNNVAFYEFL